MNEFTLFPRAQPASQMALCLSRFHQTSLSKGSGRAQVGSRCRHFYDNTHKAWLTPGELFHMLWSLSFSPLSKLVSLITI